MPGHGRKGVPATPSPGRNPVLTAPPDNFDATIEE